MTPTPSPPTILHLDTGHEWRGGQGQVLTLCVGLQKASVRQILIAPPGSPLAEKAAQAGIEVRPLKMRGEWDLLAAHQLRQIITRSGINLVHAHDAHAHSIARFATRNLEQRLMAQVTLIVSRRVDFDISGNFISRRKYLDPRIFYFAISNGVKDVLVRGGVGPDRIFIVPSGIDPARFSYNVPPSRMREELGIAPTAPVIGNIASLVDHKGHKYLIDAAPLVLAQKPNAVFVIVGDGPLRADLENQIARLNLDGKVILTGHRRDVETFLSGFNVFALSSHLEGLCTSIIDAVLLGVPVVATRTGGVPDLVEHDRTGLLVEPRDPQSLADAILQSLDHPVESARMAADAKIRVQQNFSAESLVRKSLEAYAQAQSRRKRLCLDSI